MIKLYPSNFIYISVICLSISIIARRNNWFFTWIGFELSLFGFLPLFSTNSSTTEAIIKYYLIQARGSAMYFISFLFITKNSSRLLTLGIIIKLGLFPFFQWIPVVIISIRWIGCLVLTTLQKLGPLIVIMISINTTTTIVFRVIRILIRRIIGFNQTLIRPLIAYSSITHTSWILLTTIFNIKIRIIYTVLYFTLTIFLFRSFKKRKTEKINFRPIKTNEIITQNLCLIILTGIPPFSIFFFKIYIFFKILNLPIIIIIMLIRTYISTYYYLSFIIPNLLTKENKNIKNINIILFINLLPVIFIL